MNCNGFQENFSAFIDGELNPPATDAMRRHLAACPACTRSVAEQKQLSQIVARMPSPSHSAGLTWEAISSRLDRDLDRKVVTAEREASNEKRNFRSSLLVRSVLALAAVTLLVVGLRSDPQRDREATRATASAMINLQPVVESFASGADQAMASLASLYPEANAHHHEDGEWLAPPRPSMPDGISLVSTKVVHLPFCSCPAGQCRCGPGDCDCFAGVCERKDGSQFLLVEHCSSYDVAFGVNLPEARQQGGITYQSIEMNDVLAISWERDNRRFTAIGLRNDREANEMIATNISLNVL